MQINWFTVIAQIINFLVLVWLMKKYLYKPILQAVNEREKNIAARLEDANSKMAEAKKEQDQFQNKNDAFDRLKKKMMDKAASDAEDERQKLLNAAKKEAVVLKQKLEDAAKEIQENFSDQRAQRTQQEVFSIAKKALAELASTNLEEQSVNVFIKKIKTLSKEDKLHFITAFHSDSSPVLVRSGFDLPDNKQKSIELAIAEILGDKCRYEFKTDDSIISGIELAVKGYKLSWSLAAYVNSLEKSIAAKSNEILQAV